MDELLRFKKDLKFVIFDFETENLNLLQDNNPWQLSFSVCEGQRVVEEYDLYPWWPDLQMGKDAAAITRFNYSEYKRKSSDARGCLETFEKFAYDPSFLLVGHNILNFDIYLHQIFRQKLGLKRDFSYIDRCIDTNILSKAYLLEMKPEVPITAWQYRVQSIIKKGLKSNLGAMCKHFGLPYDKSISHDGRIDCGYNRNLFLKLIQVIDI